MFNTDGQVTGIKSGGKEAKAPLVICDPSYCSSDKLKPTGKCIRAICFLDHPIPDTGDVPSVQIIMPAKQLKRNSDIYISMVSANHCVCAKGYYVAMVSATVESDKPEEEI